MEMQIDLKEILKEQSKKLREIKDALGILDNWFHDNIRILACLYLEEKYKDICWQKNYKIDGKQIDLVGLINNKPEVIAEIKTTIKKGLPAQKETIKKDIDRLNSINANCKYFFCVFEEAEQFALNYVKEKRFDKITVVNLEVF